MEEWAWITLSVILVLLIYPHGCRWWRRRQTAKQADELLASIVKGKDSFRR